MLPALVLQEVLLTLREVIRDNSAATIEEAQMLVLAYVSSLCTHLINVRNFEPSTWSTRVSHASCRLLLLHVCSANNINLQCKSCLPLCALGYKSVNFPTSTWQFDYSILETRVAVQSPSGSPGHAQVVRVAVQPPNGSPGHAQVVDPYLAVVVVPQADTAKVAELFLQRCVKEIASKEVEDLEENEGEDLCNCEFSLAYGAPPTRSRASVA